MTHTTQTLDDHIHELLQRIPTELFIAGQFQPAHNGATLSVTNPSDGSELATVASASEKEARTALDAAEKPNPHGPRHPHENAQKSFVGPTT